MKFYYLSLISFLLINCNNHERAYEKKLEVLCAKQKNDNAELLFAFKTDVKSSRSDKNKECLRKVEFFDSKIDSLITWLDYSYRFIDVKSGAEDFLREYLKVADPEFDYRPFIEDTETRYLLKLELLRIKEAFIQSQFSQLDLSLLKADVVKAFFVPEKRIVKDGELFKADFIVGVTFSEQSIMKMEVQGIDIKPNGGIGQVSFYAKADKKGLNEKFLEGKAIFQDSTYTTKLKYWVLKD
jgi:hypothetical protein